MSTRAWELTIAAALIMALTVSGIVGLFWWRGRQAAREQDRVAMVEGERQTRTSTITEVAPAPLPTGLPLRGKEGRDADGYPTQYVDRPALRSLLSHGKYEELTRYFEAYQAAFEEDPRHEYWPLDAAQAFESAEPELDAPLDAWVKATPGSFAPYAARAAHEKSVAFTSRGVKWTRDTAREDLVAMRAPAASAAADAKRAAELRPKLVATRYFEMAVAMLTVDRMGEKAALDAGLAACPSCFQIRTAYMHALTPRWGGSYEAMDDYARAAVAAEPQNPRLRLLAGYSAEDRAGDLRREKRLDEAKATIDEACALGENWQFLLERGEIAFERVDYAEALTDFDRAYAQRPGHPEMLAYRAWAHYELKHWEAAAVDLLDALRANPTERMARQLHPGLVERLIGVAWTEHRAGHREVALRLIDLDAELAPTSPRVLQTKSSIVTGKDITAGDDLSALEQAARDRPDDFRAIQQLDYALSRSRQFPRILELWNGYLTRHPDDGPAHMERCGTLHNLGRDRDALTDATRACELGVSEGCARQKQISARLGAN